jgi:protein TonB
MNILGNNASKVNAVIFENRNKSYGAYAIRESYNDSLKKSLIGLCSIICLVFGSAYTYNKMTAVSADEKLIAFDDPTINPIERMIEIDNTPLPEPVQPVEAAAPLGTATSTNIADDAVESNTTVLNDNPNTGLGDPNSTGTSATSTISSTNTVAVIAVSNSITEIPVVMIAEEMPVFNTDPNGILRYVSNNISYPEMAKSIGVEGTVYVSFVVSELGKVEGVKVMRGIGYGCDEEVVKVVSKMPMWLKAGKNAGRAVKVRYNIPVRFKLN